MSARTALGRQLLDLLVDAPSSFAALYSAANRLYARGGGPRFTVEELWESLATMEKAGWLKARLMSPSGAWQHPTDLDRARARRQYGEWLPRAPYEDMVVDEVGFWFEIDPRGRAEWNNWAGGNAPRQWTLDLDATTSTITVHAKDLTQAEQILTKWFEDHDDVEILPGSRAVLSSSRLDAHDQDSAEAGITVRVIYRKRV